MAKRPSSSSPSPSTKRVCSALMAPDALFVRNPGVDLDLSWVGSVSVDPSAVKRRAATHGKRRSVKKDYQAAWLLHAVRCIDLTTLSGDDTAGKVRRLCAKAKEAVAPHQLKALGLEQTSIQVRQDDGWEQEYGDSCDVQYPGIPPLIMLRCLDELAIVVIARRTVCHRLLLEEKSASR